VRRSDAGSVKKGEAALAAICERIQGIDADLPKGADELEKTTSAVSKTGAKEPGENIAMTATTEFCNVVQTPLEKEDTLKHESFRGSTLYKKQAAQRKGLKMRSRAHLATAAVADADVSANTGDREEEISNLIEESLDLSCASGLAYLRARSQIGGDQDSHKNRKSDNRPLEMSTLDGDIKLEYRDDFGRVQTPKEAFRAISWKFHGKVPGRKNMERRLLRLENEMRLKAMDPINELPTLRALRHVQTSDAKPYMVLSGANEK
jgi:U4/U6.U5 tri-snRNP-associated protein 1